MYRFYMPSFLFDAGIEALSGLRKFRVRRWLFSVAGDKVTTLQTDPITVIVNI